MEEQNKIQRTLKDCRPETINHFIGQKDVVDKCKVALEYAWAKTTRLPHMLCQGGPGLGKTEISRILAKELGGELKEELAQNLKKPSQVHSLLLTLKDRDVLLLDEIHELPKICQVTLYRALEDRKIFMQVKNAKKSVPIDILDSTVIGATTDPHMLMKPLRDRFEMVLDFQPYAPEDLVLLIKNRCQRLKWEVEDGVFTNIAIRSRGTPRIALRLLNMIKMTATAEGAEKINIFHLEKTFELEGIDILGLSKNENQYLKILYENGGSAPLNLVASRMLMSSKQVSEIIEPYLIQQEMVTKNSSLRVLTPFGSQYARCRNETLNEKNEL